MVSKSEELADGTRHCEYTNGLETWFYPEGKPHGMSEYSIRPDGGTLTKYNDGRVVENADGNRSADVNSCDQTEADLIRT